MGEENLFGINFEHEEKVFIYMIFMRFVNEKHGTVHDEVEKRIEGIR